MQIQRQTTTNPQTKPTDCGCEPTSRLPLSTPTITICYYYSAWKLIIILLLHEGWKAKWPGLCSKGAQPVLKAVYHSGYHDKHNCPQWYSIPRPLTALQSGMLPLDHWDPNGRKRRSEPAVRWWEVSLYTRWVDMTSRLPSVWPSTWRRSLTVETNGRRQHPTMTHDTSECTTKTPH